MTHDRSAEGGRGTIPPKVRAFVASCLGRLGYEIVRVRPAHEAPAPHLRPIDTSFVEVLDDPDFQRSCAQVMPYTVLDPPRLGNLWTLARLSNPKGNIIEVGSYRGGGALHLANSCPARRVIACDSFEGFATLDPTLDRLFQPDMFKDTSLAEVEELFRSAGRPITTIPGFFPESCARISLEPLSFAHLDVDTYESTRAALEFICPKMLARSLIVLDDYQRGAEGVDKAVAEFIEVQDDWRVLPIFPAQGLMFDRGWFEPFDETEMSGTTDVVSNSPDNPGRGH